MEELNIENLSTSELITIYQKISEFLNYLDTQIIEEEEAK